MDGVVQQDSVARRVGGLAAPACGVDEVAPEDLAVPELTGEGRDAGASERSGRLDAHRSRQHTLSPSVELTQSVGVHLPVIPKPDAEITKVVAAIPITMFVKIARLSLRKQRTLCF